MGARWHSGEYKLVKHAFQSNYKTLIGLGKCDPTNSALLFLFKSNVSGLSLSQLFFHI